MNTFNYKKFASGLLLAFLLCGFISCKKYLDKKPVQNIAIPSSPEELQSLLDNPVMYSLSSSFSEQVSDNFYFNTSQYNSLQPDQRTNYLWATDARINYSTMSAYTNPYSVIYQANFTMDALASVQFSPDQQDSYNNIKGSALYYRAATYQDLAGLFCPPYSAEKANDMGLVLRSTSDPREPYRRATVQQTYDRMTEDLKTAAALLPANPLYNTRPGKAAAYALLSRIYLSMRNYANAGLYTDSALALNNTLINYNTITAFPESPLTNREILCINYVNADFFNAPYNAIVDTTLYRSYAANDLRKTLFYTLSNGNAYWKGSYYSIVPTSIFIGPTVGELYLNRAECFARANNTTDAMVALNTLLRNRYQTAGFVDVTATNSSDALMKILAERRKELAFRGQRWTDLRRLNLEGENITLKRFINNTQYTLPPNDPRWVLMIPDDEIIRAGVQQNPR